MAKNLILVNTNPDILKYDNRKAIVNAPANRTENASKYNHF
jgi:hypothetical protein